MDDCYRDRIASTCDESDTNISGIQWDGYWSEHDSNVATPNRGSLYELGCRVVECEWLYCGC